MICAAELLRVANGSQLTAIVAVNGPRSLAGLDAVARLVDSNG
jgi:hypothetical protein